jgi:hypothetical protein
MSIKHPSPPAGVVIPSVAEALLLDDLVAVRWDGAHYFLFDGDVTPSLGDTTATYLTHQVTWPQIENPVAEGWGSASIGSDSHAVVTGPALSWTFNSSAGDKTIGGAFALDGSGNLLAAELILNGPVVLTTPGQVLPYTPSLSLSSLYGSDTV